MITALAGTNSFLLKRRLDEIVAQFIADHGDLAVERLDGEEIDAQAVIDAVQSLPFLADKKLVVVRNLSANKQAGEQVEQIINSVAESTDLIFYEPVTDKRTVFYKTLKAKTELEEFTEMDARGLSSWLITETKSQGAELGLSEANYLVERVGQNQALLANELDKLVTYDPKITRTNVDLLTEKTPQSKIFDLLDAAFGGNKKKALQIYAEQRAQKVEPQAIMGLLAWQLNILAAAKLGTGKNSGEIAKDLGMSPFPVTKAQSLVRNLGLADIRNLVNEAQRIDFLSKTKPIELDEALKTYIATI